MDCSNNKMKIAYTFVIADLFHYGHLRLLEMAASVADKVICGLLSDSSSQKISGRLVSGYDERKAVVEAITFVDEVMFQEVQDPTENLKKIHAQYKDNPIVFVHGDKWSKIPGEEYLKSINATFITQTFYPKLSNELVSRRMMESLVPGHGRLETFTPNFAVAGFETFQVSPPRVIISTKARTLQCLKPLLKSADIEESFVFTTGDWQDYAERILSRIQELFASAKVVVRSSSLAEDCLHESKAGLFHSELNVNAGDVESLNLAIGKVINSYGEQCNALDQILVQKQTEDIALSGVLFTADILTEAPFYLINYHEGIDSNQVTSGSHCKLLKIFKYAETIPRKWEPVLTAIKEIELIIPGITLDIEFAVKLNNEVIIFQVRPLAANTYCSGIKESLLGEALSNGLEVVRSNLSPNSLLSDMIFWNPAELIGHQPGNLAYSLFDKLFMQRTWNSGLVPLGYPAIQEPLMIKVLEKPYIKADLALKSLVPTSIDTAYHPRLVAYFLDKLKKYPSLHDKAELYIMFSCYDFNVPERLRELLDYGFSQEEVLEIESALISFTKDLINKSDKLFEALQEKVDKLDTFNSIELEHTGITGSLDACRELGAHPFTTAARMAFVAEAILRSLIAEGVIVEEERMLFMNSIGTVAYEMSCELNDIEQSVLSKNNFMQKYGHLRSGTYDILQPRYDQMSLTKLQGGRHFKHQVLSSDTKQRLDHFLINSPLKISFENFYRFASQFIQAREKYKFIFTRTLSHVLELIRQKGNSLDFDTQKLSVLTLEQVIALDPRNCEAIKKLATAAAEYNRICQHLPLPPLVFGPESLLIQEYPGSNPNFVGTENVDGEVCLINHKDEHKELNGRIIFIESADPGYHWIFSHDIVGLVTKYGGIASHMAICCAELGIPAAIGCGEKFETYKKCQKVGLDCRNKVIEGIRC
ncbi:hypothetical protein BVX99_02120 [bacterium F16]|nr:hypothetical protein BVX99_02035 [bacterium F16]OVE77664.1 hypothetical protein BVX99_02120 [bacterium F16]